MLKTQNVKHREERVCIKSCETAMREQDSAKFKADH